MYTTTKHFIVIMVLLLTTNLAGADWIVKCVNPSPYQTQPCWSTEPVDPDIEQFVFWNAGEVVFKMGATSNDIPLAYLSLAVQNGIGKWEAIDDSLDVSYGGATGGSLSSTDGKNSIFWVADGVLSDNQWAVTTETYDLTGSEVGEIFDADIRLNDRFYWNDSNHECTQADNSDADIESLVVHELGHALGIAHFTLDTGSCPSMHSGENFCPSGGGGCESNTEAEGLRSLADDDRNAYKFLYTGGDSVSVRFRRNHPPAKLVVHSTESTPASFGVVDARPNPFNPNTSIRYNIENAGVISLWVYNSTGQLVSVLVDGKLQAPGTYEINWNGKDVKNQDLGSGVYLVKLIQETQYSTKKIALVR